MKITISKSEYLRYTQHPKLLWLDRNMPNKKDEITEVQERIFQTGSEIGELACLKFTNKAFGIERKSVELDVQDTKELLSLARDNKGNAVDMDYTKPLPKGYSWEFETLFEACFIDLNGFYCYCDVLLRNNNSEFEIIEVKSSSKTKSYHIHDTAFQYSILLNNGLNLVNVAIAHINSDYVYHKKLDFDELFVVDPVLDKLQNYMAKQFNAKKKAAEFLTEQANLISVKFELQIRDFLKNFDKKGLKTLRQYLDFKDIKVTDKIESIVEEYESIIDLDFDTYFNSYLPKKINELLSLKQEPEAEMGSWLKYPNPCGYIEYLTSTLPVNHIYHLGSGTGIKSGDKKELQLRGINLIPEITPKIIKEFKFSVEQLAEIAEHKRIVSGKKSKVWNNIKGIKAHFSELKFPLSFFDFETVSPVLPLFIGSTPHQRLCFQYSLHIVDRRGAVTAHKEFLFNPSKKNKDPERQLVERMISDIPKEGSIVVYYADFEKSCVRNLIKRFPEYENQLTNILERIWDLYVPFESRFHYNVEQKGSASIKKVLPLFTNERSGFSYKDLAIQNGLEATMQYGDYLEGKTKFENLQDELKFRSDLLEYCKMDTMAMVVILIAMNVRLKLNLFKK